MSEITTAAEFEAAAQKAEQQAREDLGLYKKKLLAFGLLGYAMIMLVLLGLIAVVAGLVFATFVTPALLIFLLKSKLILLAIPAIWVLLRALWVRIEAPAGYTLTAQEQPRLFAEIEKIRKQLDAPKIHRVLLTAELNAAISQTPRLGVLGWNQNTLILGLELLMVLSPRQAIAVIGHEFGHLSANHSRFNGWIYRIRQTWFQIMLAFHNQQNVGAAMLRRFFDWYAPKFSAYSFALARINEFEADAVSAELTDRDDTGGALVNTQVVGPYVDERYWAHYFRKADVLPEPDVLPWAGLTSFLRTHEQSRKELGENLEKALKFQTSYENTHPSLGDRLAALGAAPVLPQPTEESAAAAWFGEQYAQVVDDFDRDWFEASKDSWSERYEYASESKQKLEELRTQDDAALNDEDLWRKAALLEEFDSARLALPVYRACQARNPKDPQAAFALGRLTFDRDDDELLAQMQLAMEEPDLVLPACQFAYHYLARLERLDEAEWWRDRAEQHMAMEQASAQERSSFDVKDIVPSELSVEIMSAVVEQLLKTGRVKHAWIAQKKSDYKNIPAIAIAMVGKGLHLDRDMLAAKIQNGMKFEFDCAFAVVARSGGYAKLANKIAKVGTQIIKGGRRVG